MITAHVSMGVRWNFLGFGAIMNFSKGWPKNFPVGPSVVKFDFITSKLKEKHFLTKHLMSKYKITKSTGLSPQSLLTLHPCIPVH